MPNDVININGVLFPTVNSRVGWYSEKLQASFTGRVTKISITANGKTNSRVNVSVWRDEHPTFKTKVREYVKDPLTKKYHWVTVEAPAPARTVCFTTPDNLYFM